MKGGSLGTSQQFIESIGVDRDLDVNILNVNRLKGYFRDNQKEVTRVESEGETLQDVAKIVSEGEFVSNAVSAGLPGVPSEKEIHTVEVEGSGRRREWICASCSGLRRADADEIPCECTGLTGLSHR